MAKGEHARPANAAPDGVASGWLATLFAISVVTLLFQLFPGVWAWLLGMVDVRGWTWRSYATLSAGALLGLVALKAYLDREQ